MIITCNCGEKKFTLPDNSIPASGRLVQCGFCGLKWKQFPIDEVKTSINLSYTKCSFQTSDSSAKNTKTKKN